MGTYENLKVFAFYIDEKHPWEAKRGQWGWKLVTPDGGCVDSYVGYKTE